MRSGFNGGLTPLSIADRTRAKQGSSETGSAVDLLSDRELEILHQVGHGAEIKEIATQLHLSRKTVQSYRDRIRQKLVFANARELARFAHEWVESEEG